MRSENRSKGCAGRDTLARIDARTWDEEKRFGALQEECCSLPVRPDRARVGAACPPAARPPAPSGLASTGRSGALGQAGQPEPSGVAEQSCTNARQRGEERQQLNPPDGYHSEAAALPSAGHL